MDTIDLLKKLISIPSLPTKEHAISDFIADWLAKRNFEVKKLEVDFNGRKAGPVVFATYNFKEKGRSLVFAGHMDTAIPTEGWNTDPFEPVVEGGRLYGLGAYDMKSGIAALLKAAERLTKMDLKGRISCSLVSDFEAFSTGTYVLSKSGLLDGYDGGILPDEYSEKRAIVEKGGRVIYDIRLTSTKPQHFVELRRGKKVLNPLLELGTVLSRLHELKIKGTMLPVRVGGGLQELYPSIPDNAQLLIDRALVFGETVEGAVAEMQEWLESLGLESKVTVEAYKGRPTPWMKPYKIDLQEPILQVLEKVCRDKYGFELEKARTSYVADNYYINIAKVPMLYAVGPKGDDCHAPNEYVEIESVRECENILVDVGKEFLK